MRISFRQALALPHLADKEKCYVGPSTFMLEEWLQNAPSEIDKLVDMHSNITMVLTAHKHY